MVVPLKEISIVNLLKLNNPIIIDIRKSYVFNISHIPNSINIPYLDFIIEFSNYLDKNKIYYICDKSNFYTQCIPYNKETQYLFDKCINI